MPSKTHLHPNLYFSLDFIHFILEIRDFFVLFFFVTIFYKPGRIISLPKKKLEGTRPPGGGALREMVRIPPPTRLPLPELQKLQGTDLDRPQRVLPAMRGVGWGTPHSPVNEQ